MAKFKELDIVKTLIDTTKVKKGTIGTIVHCFIKPNEAYEVEFDQNIDPEWPMDTYLPDQLELYLEK